MNERATMAPSIIRTTGRDSFANPLHPVVLAICGALISLLFAAHIRAAGPLDTVTKTVGSVTQGVTQAAGQTVQPVTRPVDPVARTTVDAAVKTVDTTAQGTTAAVGQSAVRNTVPTTQDITRPADAATSSTAPTTHAAGGTMQTVATAAQPVAQQAPQIVGALTPPVSPVAQAIRQPVTQTIATVTAPVVQQARAIVPAVTEPVRTVTNPILQPVTRVIAPVVPVGVSAVPSVMPIGAVVASTVVAAAAPMAANIAPPPAAATTVLVGSSPVTPAPIAPTARAAAVERAQPVRATRDTDVPAPVAPANRAERSTTPPPLIPPTAVASAAVTHTVLTDGATHMQLHDSAALIAPPVARAIGPDRSLAPADGSVARATISPSVMPLDLPAAQDGVTSSAKMLAPASSPPSPAPTFPNAPLTAMSGAMGAGDGHGLSFLLALVAATWAVMLTGRRIRFFILAPSQPTYRPLVSPG